MCGFNTDKGEGGGQKKQKKLADIICTSPLNKCEFLPRQIRAAEAKPSFPSRHDWDAFFKNNKDMNEMKPGERPDTIHIAGVPTKWFLDAQVQCTIQICDSINQVISEVSMLIKL